MNVLFVNYGDFTTNSLNHIGGFANVLSARGHACVVAVPSNRESITAVAEPLFIPALYSEVLGLPALFPDGRPADVIHAWTSREGVRKFVVAYQRALTQAVPLIVHLEDNEEHLICAWARRPMAELLRLDAAELDALVVDALPHPVRHRSFLHLADAVTVIVDRLREQVPATVPTELLAPGVDGALYRPQAADPALRQELGLKEGERVIVFTGSNTFANEPEMRELYVAVRLLNQRGVPTRLVRTGFNSPHFLNGVPAELQAHVLDLGFVAKARLPGLLALADVLVQPGRTGPFNDYRLPSKLPEFLASGRPVVLPPTNVALDLQDGVEALFLRTGTPEDIADCCQRIFGDPALAQRLGGAGAAFARRHFDLAARTEGLLKVYERVAGRPAAAPWGAMEGVKATDLTVAANLLARALAPGPGRSKELASELGSAAEAASALSSAPVAPSATAVAGAYAQLAADLAALDRWEEDRSAGSALEQLALAHKDLQLRLERAQLRFEQTTRHADNLAAVLEAKRRHLKLTRQMSTQHVRNLDSQIALLKHDVQAREERLAQARQEADLLRGEIKAGVARTHEARARINEIERRTREQADAAQQEHLRLAARIGELDRELTARDQKVRRMLGSLSWKLTAPLRDVERLVARLRGRAYTPLAPPAGPSTNAPALPQPESAPAGAGGEGGADRAAPIAADGQEPGAAAPAARYSYAFNFDHPRTWSTTANKLLILGWCYEHSGAPIKGIRARLADQVTEGVYGSKRLDVMAAHEGRRQAEYCGIKIDVRTFLGDHRLVVELLHEDGWNPYFETTVHVGQPGDATEMSEYEKWCEQHESLSDDDRAAIRTHIAALARRPVISVVMPVFNPPAELLTKAIESVRAQRYPHWELCLADDASTDPAIRPLIERFAAQDPRIKAVFRPENGHICAASNSAVALATGEYVALFDHDDVLHPNALYEVAVELDAHPDAKFLYTDEDKIDGEDRRFDPYFKPDWNPDLLYGQNYTSHLSIFASSLLRELEGFRAGYEGSQDWDLTLRASERIPASAIRHIPKVLYHWRAVPGSTALQLAEKSYPVEAARRALADHFLRRGETVELITVPGDHWRIKYPLPAVAPRVTLIVPTRNALKFVRQAVESILTKTDYPNYEILIVDNNSDDPETLDYFAAVARDEAARVRILRHEAPFNYSAINNAAVAHADGEIIGLLNNDVEAINRDWLTEMVSQALRPGIGAVGAMLYYPLNTVQHAGVILGLGGVAGHPFKEFPRGDQGQKNRLRLVQNYSAVTAACLVIRKDRYLEVGGLNERDLPIAFNDVDLCCKLVAAGYRNLWTPYAEFYHHESATRGIEDTPEKKARFQSEIDYMMTTWGEFLLNDPAYNPNLTLVGEDFSPAYLPRTKKPWLNHLP